LKKKEFSGRVFSGRGEGEKFLELPWVKQQIEEKLGFTPYNGTLNLRLSEQSVKRRRLLEMAASLEVCPAEGYCLGRVFRASVVGLGCAVVLPAVAGYPEDVLEIIAPVNLREEVRLVDGAEVVVTVAVESA
jgi:riboflavin kinase